MGSNSFYVFRLLEDSPSTCDIIQGVVGYSLACVCQSQKQKAAETSAQTGCVTVQNTCTMSEDLKEKRRKQAQPKRSQGEQLHLSTTYMTTKLGTFCPACNNPLKSEAAVSYRLAVYLSDEGYPLFSNTDTTTALRYYTLIISNS